MGGNLPARPGGFIALARLTVVYASPAIFPVLTPLTDIQILREQVFHVPLEGAALSQGGTLIIARMMPGHPCDPAGRVAAPMKTATS